MARRKKWFRFFLWIGGPILIMGMLGLVFLYYFFDPNLYRNVLQKSLTTTLGREVSIGRAKINFWGGVGIAFENVRIKDRSLPFDLVQSKKLILSVKLLPLLKKEIHWNRIVLESPTLHLLRDRNGRFNVWDNLLTAKGVKDSQQKMIQTLSTFFGGSFSIRDGEITFSDEDLGGPLLMTQIRSFNLRLSNVSYQKPFPFQLDGKLVHSEKEGYFSIAGRVQNLPEDLNFSEARIEAEVKIKGIETSHFWPYLEGFLPMKMISGSLDLEGHYGGTLAGAFRASAKMKWKDIVYDHPQVFASILNPKEMDLDLDMEYHPEEIKVHRISLELPEIKLFGKGRVYGIGTKEMGLEAEARSDPFDLSGGKKFIPYRILIPEVSDPLSRAEGSGSVQIVSVKLSGKMPEIEHCDRMEYAHTLSAAMKLNGAQVKLPWKFPVLQELRGRLFFKEGDLHFHAVEGKFLHSTMRRTNGTFLHLLHVPTLQFQSEGNFNLGDFISLIKMGEPAIASPVLSSFTSLSGMALYQLSAKGDLKLPLHFQHQGVYRLFKARFTHPQVPFPILINEAKVDLSNESLQWSGTRVEFGHSFFLTNGLWKFGEKSGPFEMMAAGNADLKNILSFSQSSLFPEEIRSRVKGIETLSGTGQFSFKCRREKEQQSPSYEGEWMPQETSLLLKGFNQPLTLKGGVFSFTNFGVVFSKLKIQLGNSSLALDGFIKEGNLSFSTTGVVDLKYLHSLLQSSLVPDQIRSEMEDIQEMRGRAEVQLKWLGRTEDWISVIKEGKILLKEVSFQYRKIPFPLSRMEGSLLFSPKEIRFDEVKGTLGDSPIAFSGSISRTEQRPESGQWVSFQLFSPQMDFTSFFSKREEASPISFEKVRDWLSHWSFNGRVDIGQGKYGALDYQDLKVEMKTVGGKLLFHPLQSKVDGGDIWGEAWIQPTEKGIRFEIKPRISNIDAKAFLRTLLQKSEEEKVMVSGRIHINKVGLMGEGEDFQKMKESLNGSLRLEIDEGVIERFNVLSKIFSILNVSQILTGRLPDLKTKGLPFHQISANIYVKDGIASTDDLVVNSDSMKITLIGKVDLGKNQIDAKIGVHPLVTLDTVLSKVPIAGYILTGKDKAFLSYVYEVKGDLGDPKIEAIPIKSLGQGFFGIITRLLETPLRPLKYLPSEK
jgi:uncharacterized protein involved in outer membrane biogenesis